MKGTMMTTITITITRERLGAMDDNAMKVYGTPNTWETYWAPRPNWQNDRCLATVHDFYQACDLDYEDCNSDGEDAEEILELTVHVDDVDEEDNDDNEWQ
jgi:hypothetical protein